MDSKYILAGTVILAVFIAGCTQSGKETEITTTVAPTTVRPTTSVATTMIPTTIPTTVSTTVPEVVSDCGDLCTTLGFESGECKRSKSECRAKGGIHKAAGNKYCAATKRECCCFSQ